MIPDNVEKIIMTKEDYDRNVEQLLLEKIELQQRIDKAIDYIINHSEASGSFDGKVFYVERVENIKNGTKLLYILKGVNE